MLNLMYPTIDIEGKRSATGIELFGTADLPDGTILRYEVHPAGLIGALTGRRRGKSTTTPARTSRTIRRSPVWASLDIILAIQSWF